MAIRHLVFGALMALLLVVLSCSPGGGERPPASPTPTPQEAERLAQLKALEQELNPLLVPAIPIQPWYKGGQTSDDGLRLVQLMATYFKNGSVNELNTALRRFPEGLPADVNDFFERVKKRWPVASIVTGTFTRDGITPAKIEVMEHAISLSITYTRFVTITRPLETQPWFVDGLTPEEVVLFKAALGSELYTWEMPRMFWGNFAAAWFLDGADPEELALVEAAGIVAQNGRREVATTLLQLLESKRYVGERVDLPLSGPVRLLLVIEAPALTPQSPQVTRALDLVRTAIPKVEAFAGPFKPRFAIVRLVDNLGPQICGQASRPGEQSIDGDITGVVTIDLRCLQERTVVHELAHLFAGTVGPAWYMEGVADLTVQHVSKITGSYLGTTTRGKIEPESRPPTENEAYRNQGGLGAKLMVDIHRIIGTGPMSAAIQEIAAMSLRRGHFLLETIVKHTPEAQRARVVELITARVELAEPLKLP